MIIKISMIQFQDFCPTFWELKDFFSELFQEKLFIRKDSKNKVELSLNGGELDLTIWTRDSGVVREIFLVTWSGGWSHLQSSLHLEWSYKSNSWSVSCNMLDRENAKRTSCNFDTDKSGILTAINNFSIYLFADAIRDKRIDSILN